MWWEKRKKVGKDGGGGAVTVRERQREETRGERETGSEFEDTHKRGR